MFYVFFVFQSVAFGGPETPTQGQPHLAGSPAFSVGGSQAACLFCWWESGFIWCARGTTWHGPHDVLFRPRETAVALCVVYSTVLFCAGQAGRQEEGGRGPRILTTATQPCYRASAFYCSLIMVVLLD